MNIQQIASELKNACWLEPVELIHSATNPLNALIAKIKYSINSGSNESKKEKAIWKLNHVAYTAAVAFPGNLQSSKGNMDSEVYAANVMSNEELRIGFKERFNEVINDLLEIHSFNNTQTDRLVLPFLDHELYFEEHINFLKEICHYLPDKISIVIVCDVKSLLDYQNKIKNNHKIVNLTTSEFNQISMIVQYGR